MYIIVLDDGETWALSSGCKVLQVSPDFWSLPDQNEWVKYNFPNGITINTTESVEFTGDLLVNSELDDEDYEDEYSEEYYEDNDDNEYDIDDNIKSSETLTP